ncbi:MFS transporter [Candidatus Parcubacteria bacterium]|nr:MFS transporter [Candidatus Parcubacteria bacterium]
MRLSVLRHKTVHGFLPVYLADIFFCLHTALTAYVASSFLRIFLTYTEVSLLFVCGALGNLFLFTQVPRLLRRFGIRGLFLLLLSVETVATLELATSHDIGIVVLSFFVQESVIMIIFYLLDIFLEDCSTNGRTGHIRGVYLTLGNIAIASAPFLMGLIAPTGNFRLLYVYSTLSILPLFISGFFFRHLNENKERHNSLKLPWRSWSLSKDVRNVTLARFALEFFYSGMVIYTPLYLNAYLGFSWVTIGVIFTFMLLPFVLFEALIGEVADRFGHEKYIMSVGLLLMGMTLFSMTKAPASVVVWIVLLFASRLGACATEITTESFFFRRVDYRDTGLISIFRLTRPLSLIAAALLGAFVVHYMNIEIVFSAFGLVVLYGLRQSLSLNTHPRT